MRELSSKEKISLANILKDHFDGGDWQELMANTECEFYNISQLLKDVKWGNDTLKQSCIEVVRFILDRDSCNLTHIWNIEGTPNRVERKSIELYKKIISIIEDIPIVQNAPMVNRTEVTNRLLQNAEASISIGNPDEALDRMHTALHSHFRSICDQHDIEYSTKDRVDELSKKIGDHIQNNDSIETNNDVFKTLRSCNSILNNMNNLRNDYSLSHPNESLLSTSDAMFSINLARSMVTLPNLRHLITRIKLPD